MDYRIPKELFRFTERCLYDYKENCARLKLKLEYLEGFTIRSSSDYSSVAELGCRIDGGGEDVPVAQRILELEDLDGEVALLRRRTEPVSELLGLLDEQATELKTLLKLKYFERRTEWEITEAMHWSARSYHRRREALVLKAAGLIFGTLGRYWEIRLANSGRNVAKQEAPKEVLS